MNRLDLRSYREGDTTVHSMIPGISNINSVGTSPLLRKGANVSLSQGLSANQSTGYTHTPSHLSTKLGTDSNLLN